MERLRSTQYKKLLSMKKSHFQLWLKDDSGQALSEYGLLLAFIAVVAIVAVTAFGTQIKATFNNLTSKMSGAATVTPTP